MAAPWKKIILETQINPDGILIVTNIAQATQGLFESASRLYWVINDKSVSIFMGGHYHPVGTKDELMAPILCPVEIELHSMDLCEVVRLDPEKHEALIIPSGVEHLAHIIPGGIVVGVASSDEQVGEICERINCKCRSGRG